MVKMNHFKFIYFDKVEMFHFDYHFDSIPLSVCIVYCIYIEV